jgi:hypothetical protein
MHYNRFLGLAFAAALSLSPMTAMAQPADSDIPLPLRVIAADDALTAAIAQNAPADELATLGSALDVLCDSLGYPDRTTCLSIARNERWIRLDTPRCVFAAGRAMGCSAAQIDQMAHPD